MEVNWLEFWYQAASSPLGVELTVSDPEKVKQLLYRARASSTDPSLHEYTIKTAPLNPGGALWIVKRKQADDAQAQP